MYTHNMDEAHCGCSYDLLKFTINCVVLLHKQVEIIYVVSVKNGY